jgi:hypothetical protein
MAAISDGRENVLPQTQLTVNDWQITTFMIHAKMPCDLASSLGLRGPDERTGQSS